MKKGISDTVIRLSAIGIEPDSIKNFIRDAYNNWDLKPRYLLLVGTLDSESPLHIPGYEGEETDYQYDCGYGDVVNAHRHIEDSLMDISVGRFPANSVEDVQTMVNKTIAYERRADRTNPFWTTTGTTIVREDGDPVDDSIYWEDTNILRAHWRALAYAPSDSFSKYLGDNSDSVAQAGNAGRALITYRGQAVGGWWNPFHRVVPDEWSNGGMLPIVMSATCITMDYEDGDTSTYGHRFVVAGSPEQPLGAAAFFGTAEMGSISTRSPAFRAFFSAIYEGCSLKLGPATLAGRAAVLPLTDSEDLEPYYEWNLFGDPSLHMWIGGDTPVVAEIENLPSTALYQESLSLILRVTTVESGNPVRGALVCAWKPNEVFATGRSDISGYCTLAVYAATVGPMYVTASEGRERTFAPKELGDPPVLPVEETLVFVYPPPPPPWTEVAEMPDWPSYKPVNSGGWLAYDGNGLVYAAKGNKVRDFYSYSVGRDSWTQLQLIPEGTKLPKKGCRGITDCEGHVFMTKGSNTSEFWCYHAANDSWSQLADVPLGSSVKKVKGGTDMVYTLENGTGYVYLLKGYRNEFHRYNTTTGTWQTLPSVPGVRVPNGRWNEGSWLVFDGNQTIYAHRASYNELCAYDLQSGAWGQPADGMPFVGRSGRSRKSKDGGSAAWLGDRACALKGGKTQEFWAYFPTGDTWVEMDTIPSLGSSGLRKLVSAGGDLVFTDDGILALKGNKVREFWRHTPQTGEGAFAGRGSGDAPSPGVDGLETGLAEGMSAMTPRWSNDGTAVCYVREAEDGVGAGYDQVYLVRTSEPGTEVRVVDIAMDCSEPVFHPSGSHICFVLDDTVTERLSKSQARTRAMASCPRSRWRAAPAGWTWSQASPPAAAPLRCPWPLPWATR